ncbi:MAG: sensor domain-containing phosphodiesterase [Epsilonproteobacteria bacterium]|nr:sensor domain-containing phosphodiesterase [Campylobacterota bacterium]
MDSNIILGSAALVSASISWGVCQSLSSKKKAVYENFIKEKISYYNNLFDILEDNLVLLDENNEIAYINDAMIRFLGIDKKEIPRHFPMPEVVKGDTHISLEDILKDVKINPYKFIINHGNLILYINHRKVSINLYISQYHTLDINSKRKVRIILFKTNVNSSDKDNFEHKHKLTRLPNHLKLQKDLQNTFIKLHLNDRKLAIVSMEIDNFASLRAILGHEQTNNILVTFANYLNHISQEFSFSVYHTIHNSFILFMDNINNETDIYSVINLIQDKLKTLYRMENSILHLTISVGIALYPTNSSTGELLDNSYKALSQAKDKGQGWVIMYKPVQKSHAYDELKLYNDMHSALKRNEFEIYYQPIVDSKTRKIVSAEALIRWKHPVHGMVRPDIFIPIMEKTGFIIKLGRYIIEEVLKQQKRWELFKFKQVPVSINLSLAELEKENFVQVVETQLANHKVSSELIKYEITEGLAMENEERTYKQLLELRKLGVNILLDDFGTGYTSFSYIKKIPANIIKIDRSLVINILTSKTDQGITKSIIDLAHSIGMKVVVEGVEDEHMFNMLRDIGADYIQGYYISKPVPVFEFQKFLRS